MILKKKISIFLASMILCTLLASCGSSQEQPKETTTSNPSAETDIQAAPSPLADGNPQETITVDATSNVHTISDAIYGMAFAEDEILQLANVPVNRWGGNSKTVYNWKNDTDNSGLDWYFINYAQNCEDPAKLPDGSTADLFVEKNKARSADTMMTIPMIGYVPKSRELASSFSVKKYGSQEKTETPVSDAGNGIRADGTQITDNDPLDTYMKVDETFMGDWVRHLVKKYGTAAEGGVKYYLLDNEPFLWDSTHRDIHPEPVSADELVDLSIRYALAIKEADPTALVVGYEAWGWLALKETQYDMVYSRIHEGVHPDRDAKGYEYFAEYYLQCMKEAEKKHGKRLLDVFTTHMYPQGGETSEDDSIEMQEKRMRSTRALWDLNYVDESWINEPIKMIPRLKELVNENYLGTQTGITEYVWGRRDFPDGGIAMADILGIFGREGLDVGTMWTRPTIMSPTRNAFSLYRNYDGKQSTFGDTSIRCDSSNTDRIATFASVDSKTGQMKIVVLGKYASKDTPITINISNFETNGTVKAYQWVGDALMIAELKDEIKLENGTLTMMVPPYSGTMLVIEPK